jgi:hypothetical protein
VPSSWRDELTSGARPVSPYLYWAWGFLLLLPVWLPTYLVTEDGLAHLYWIEVYRALGRPDNSWSHFFVRHLVWDKPHHLLHFGLQYALATILEPHLAQKVVVSLIILSWVGAIHFLARAMFRELTLGAFAALLLIHSSWLYNGFFAFMGAMPLVLVTLGLLARLSNDPTPADSRGSYVAIGILGVVAYYAHFFVGALFLMLGIAWLIFPWHPLRFSRVYLASAMLPTGALAAWYLGSGTLGAGGMTWEPFIKVAARFFGLAFFRGLAAPTLPFWTALAAFGSVVAFLLWQGIRADPFRRIPSTRRFVFLLAAFLAIAYFFAPAAVGEAWPFHARLHFAALAWLLPSLPSRMSRRQRNLVLMVVSLLLGWQVVTFSGREMRFSHDYAQVLRQADAIPAGAIVVSSPYGASRYEGSFLGVLATVPEDIALRRRAVLLNSFFPAHPFYWVLPRPGFTPPPEFRIDLQQDPHGGLQLLIYRRPGAE